MKDCCRKGVAGCFLQHPADKMVIIFFQALTVQHAINPQSLASH